MAKVDDFLNSTKRPAIGLPDGTNVSCDDRGDLEIKGESIEKIHRGSLQKFVDWIIDTYGITPTGFERKGGA